ncbi:MAG: hypothetical protein LAP40_19475 [Acidobacteriia bacterium]|nr:hypothetical protein [Terriglobia bacterium]
MDFAKIISELRSQREDLDRAIFSLERLALQGAKRRGRPRKGMSEVKPNAHVLTRTMPTAAKRPKAVAVSTGT